MKSVALHNLGCKVNAYELEVIGQKLQEKGYRIVPFDDIADVYIVNTCTVTNIADRKSRQMLHRAKRRNPDAVVVAVGCYVQTGKEEALLDGSIDLAVGNNRKKELPEILEAFLREREASGKEGTSGNAGLVEEKTFHYKSVVDINKEQEYEEMMPEDSAEARQTAEHTRAYIKIQDGCNQFCSYCIIPYARGRVRSRKPEDVLREVKQLAAGGCREVVLTGIHISSYGIDFIQKTDGDYLESGSDLRQTAQERQYLLNLVREIAEVPGIARIRLGSLEPRIITESFVGGLAALPKVCPHFHLSLQSGCDATLKRMNRHYTAEEYYEKVKLLRKAFDHPAITTDVIVGFPGETDEEFEITAAFLEKVHFFEMHVFKYSVRKGTVAAGMEDQVPEQVKNERSARLLTLERRMSREYREQYIGKEITVLTEDCAELLGENWRTGHTQTYVKAAVPAGQAGRNELITGRVTGFLTDEILRIKLHGTNRV
ncbi:MAG TPA: tRNA (N(6)-L-threonylcarbamoyladenosine(37)-C(2))-methylthiotransferase MtaB [Candidatus Eisenbergiella merdipullorum]|uniref:Threonylcarbamoyladenosine tRNA methylthiotransferase MtaB n=1 Tax=Candidatus Eisenbergiella merdipullorum TaxID=2838553 RepID=A0A9D2I9P8_9FIRM|nr:tRNA (N(6)-L-threonylcarbamoyladenosine(37)-C(2))-methylthiotransferase MtaB [Candidatus Eisenbergiella merdipullorum]